MPDADTAARMIDAEIHIDPDPVRVYRLVLSHGVDAAFERWGWLPKAAVGRLAERGRAAVQGGRSPTNTRRAQTPAQEREIVSAVHELGGVDYAARVHGVSAALVTKLLVEHGHSSWPRASRRMADVAAARARVALYVEGRRA